MVDNSVITIEDVFEAQENVIQLEKEIATLVAGNKTDAAVLTKYKSLFSLFVDCRWDLVLIDWKTNITSRNQTTVAHPIRKDFVKTSKDFKDYCGFVNSNIAQTSASVYIQKWLPKYGQGLNPANSATMGGSPYNKATGDKVNFPITDLREPGYELSWLAQQRILNRNKALKTKRNLLAQNNAIINDPKAPKISLVQDSDGTLNTNAVANFKYNVGSVQESYLSDRSSFLKELTAYSNSNAPSSVTNASQLWINGTSNKGMIQPWLEKTYQEAIASKEDSGALPGGNITLTQLMNNVYAFQFLYNPASIDMVYQGQLGASIDYLASGNDPFNALGGQNVNSTISFNILINRMHDFKYYDKDTGKIAKKYKNSNLYVPRQPEEDEQLEIYRKGTMYDLEFLFRAVLKHGMPSYFHERNSTDGQTADMGFIMSGPVELHLGTSLRYMGTVNQINVSHVLFDERMVPIFTNVSFAFGRYIDSAKLTMDGEVNRGGR